MKLVLFDIDGTLLSTDGAGRRAITRALVEVYGVAGPDDHRFDGKTDPQIVHELMALAGIAPQRVEAGLQVVFERYAEFLRWELTSTAHTTVPNPGVPELLDALEMRGDVILGLLTGNVVPGARAKLGAAGILPSRFVVGAFGSDHAVRAELPAIAHARAKVILGVDLPAGDVTIIGDTPADLTCGRGIGARGVGVATGHYSVDDLAGYGAAAILPDFRDTAAAVRGILGEP
ncbi:MAG TPA: HAD family hydrolase [Gemmatimonadaceae bacterium]|nr:HAD family hydrolase [Gemmatimonadaceae bacterium]